jgi:hypothetical protein
MSQLELRRHAGALTRAHKERDQVRTDLAKAQSEIARLRRELKSKKASSRKPARKPAKKRRK